MNASYHGIRRGPLDEHGAELLAAKLRPDYLDVRVLPDGSVAALGNLMFTRAIFLGCTAWGWTSRFCFADRELASKRFAELQSEEDQPEGCIASRGGSGSAA